jgi:ABC-2 type transport system permease protein
MSGPAFESRHAAPAEISVMRRFVWSVRRELWENRSIYMAPVMTGVVFVLAFMIIGLPRHWPQIRAAAVGASMDGRNGSTPLLSRNLLFPYDLAAGLMMLTTMVVAVFYCVDTLYGERRDRSILFWKSLPVSDLVTVLSKMSIPLLVLPVVGWAVTSAVQLIMALGTSLALTASGVGAAAFWAHLALPRISVLLLYHLLTVHALWWAPFFAWMLLVSAWARRAPILWVALPVIVVTVVEKIAFNTWHILNMLQNRLARGSHDVVLPSPDTFPIHPMTHMTPLSFMTNPTLWIGFLIAAVFLAGAVRLRRYREPV